MNVGDILEDLDEHGFEDTPTAMKLRVINETLADAAAREPWPQLEKTAVLAFDGSSASPTAASMPDDFLAVTSLSYTNKRGGPTNIRLDDFQERLGYLGAEGGEPLVYYFEGTTLKFWRVPTSSTTLLMKYISTPAELDENSQATDIWLPTGFHRGVIVNGAVYKLYLLEDDAELAREFERLYEKALSNMRNALWTQHFEGDYIHVVNEDDWHTDY